MLILDEYETTDIALETAQGNPISNVQCREISLYNRALFGNLEKKYGEYIEKRVEPSAIYNCHGLVFASRRTAIESSVEVSDLRQSRRLEIVNRSKRYSEKIL